MIEESQEHFFQESLRFGQNINSKFHTIIVKIKL